MYIYVDHAATTRIADEALRAMTPFYTEYYGNASSMHTAGRKAFAGLKQARTDMAKCLGAKPEEIYFTSGGSEADNWAIRTVAEEAARNGKKHIVSTKFEHHAVLHTLDDLASKGFEITLLDVHSDGIVRPAELEAAIRPDTALVTVMYANNEIGTVQPIEELGAICRRHDVIFHTDAVQAVGHLPIDVEKQNIDMLSLSGHKFHGPKGVGALVCRSSVGLSPLIFGGEQERGVRAGTENIPGIVGMATALRLATDEMEQKNEKIRVLRDRLIAGLGKIDRTHLNGDPIRRLPGNASFCFEGVEGESMLMELDMMGICASSGSACTSGSVEPSHVLLAIGVPPETAHGSLRISIDISNTAEEIDTIIAAVTSVVDKYRRLSPVWESITASDNQ